MSKDFKTSVDITFPVGELEANQVALARSVVKDIIERLPKTLSSRPNSPCACT